MTQQDIEALLSKYPRQTLHFLRDQMGLSQGRFAFQLHVPQATVGRWEAQRRAISPAYRRELARLLRPYVGTPEWQAFVGTLAADGECPEPPGQETG